MKMWKISLVVMVAISLGIVGTDFVEAQPAVIYDDFDDGILDPAWSLVLSGLATGLAYSEIGTELIVTDVPASGVHTTWSTATLSQTIQPLDDFQAEMDISWDGTPIKTGTQLAAVEKVQMVFDSFPYTGSGGPSFFGTISVDSISVRPEPDILDIGIDIRPGGEQNPVNLRSNGVLPVAILGEEEFYVYDIDLSSLVLDGATPKQKGNSGQIGVFKDVNDDGLTDLLLHFELSELGIDPSATELTLDGLLNDGTALVGSDLIRIVPSGDANADGAVDGVDFGLWQAGKGGFDDDGDTDGVDFGIWQNNYGSSVGVAAMTAIPEPATLLLFALGALVLAKKRRSQ